VGLGALVVALAAALVVALGAFSSGSGPSQSTFNAQIAAVCGRAQTAAAKIPPNVPGNSGPWLHGLLSVFEGAISQFRALTPPSSDATAYRAYVNELTAQVPLVREVIIAADQHETARLQTLAQQLTADDTTEKRDAQLAGFTDCNVSSGSSASQPTAAQRVAAAAKELAHVAQVIAETYATDNNGSYVGLTPTVLNNYESVIQITPGHGNAWVSSVHASASGYSITVTPASGSERFKLTRDGNGAITRTCTPAPAPAAGCDSGTW
jgi:hypothetical protein